MLFLLFLSGSGGDFGINFSLEDGVDVGVDGGYFKEDELIYKYN